MSDGEEHPAGPGRVPTMHDVAALAGVSVATVSRVVNASPKVSASARDKVTDAVRRLGFVSSPTARALRPGVKSLTWGLLVEGVSGRHIGRLVDELDSAAQEHHSTLLVSTTQKRLDRELHLIREMVGRRVDGLFVVAANGDHRSLQPVAGSVPVVYLDRIPFGRTADVITFDHYAAIEQQVDRLWRHGHRRIAFVGGEVDEDPGVRRFAAYRDGLLRRGAHVDPDLISVGHLETPSAAQATARLLDLADPPTAVVATAGPITLGVLRAVVDRDAWVEITGSEDIEGGFLSPVPLHVITADLTLLAREGVAVLLERMARPCRPGEETIKFLQPTVLSYPGRPRGDQP